jgi:hypothetical protein
MLRIGVLGLWVVRVGVEKGSGSCVGVGRGVC